MLTMITHIRHAVLFVTVISLVAGWTKNETVDRFNEDSDLSLHELVQKLGWDGLDSMELTLSDGYIINILRIKRDGAEKLKPILLVHGVTGCADSFLIGRNKSPAIFFANQNYDIWIINHRGTIHSSKHTRFNSSTDKDYWAFSFQELGLVDLPAAIDLILSHNDHEKLALIGHSEGVSIIITTLAELPEYNSKVAISFHWGSAVYHSVCKTFPVIGLACNFNHLLSKLLDSLGIVRVYPPVLRGFVKEFCKIEYFRQPCRSLLQSLLQIPGSRLTTELQDNYGFIASKAMCGGSIRELLHLMQIGQTGTFSRYDFGYAENIRIYNSSRPPLIHLERITSPTVFWCGISDMFCSEANLVRIASEIPNVVSTRVLLRKKEYGHVDFLVTEDTPRVVYRNMNKLLDKYFK